MSLAAERPLEVRTATLPVALALFAVYVIWGSTYFVMRIALEAFPPFLMSGLRFVAAGSILFVIVRARGAPLPTAREWRLSAAVGVLLLTMGNGAVAFAEQHVSSSLAAVTVATMPLWAAIFAGALGQRPTGREWAGLVLGFVGVAILSAGGDLRAHVPSALVLLLGPVSWALGSVWSRRLTLPKGPMAAAAQMLCAGSVMLAISAARGERLASTPTARPVVALAYLIVFGSLIAFSAYGYLLRSTRPAIATSYAYVNPIVALLVGVGLGGEQVGPLTLIAAAIILGGVALLTVPTRGSPETHRREA